MSKKSASGSNQLWLATLNHYSTPAVLVLIALTILAGLGYSLVLGDQLRFPDEYVYYNHAKNFVDIGIFSYDGVHPTASKAPGYSFIFTLVMPFSKAVLPLRMMNYLALGVALWLVYSLVRKDSAPVFGALAVLLCTIFPLFFYTASTLYPQIVAATLLLLIIFLAERKPQLTLGISIVIGLLGGYLVLMIPTFLFLLAAFLVWRLAVSRDRLKYLLAVVLVVVLVNLPWTIRNYQIFNTFVFITTDGGKNLLLGNNENTTPNAGVNADISKHTTAVAASAMDEAAADRYYRSAAVNWISSNKNDAARLYLLKLINHFNFRNDLQTTSESSVTRDIVLGASYLPLLLIFIFRIVTLPWLRFSRFELFLIVMYLAWALIMAVFFTRVRYRLPLDFLLIMVVTLFIYQVVARVSTEIWQQTPSSASTDTIRRTAP